MDLLKQAILDAEQLRETAMESAKAAILETFQPRIQRLVSQKLSEDEDMDDEDDMKPSKDIEAGAGKMSAPPSDGEDYGQSDEYEMGGEEEEMEEPIEEPVSAEDLPDEDQVEESISDFLVSLVGEGDMYDGEDDSNDFDYDIKEMMDKGEGEDDDEEFTLEIVGGDDDMDDKDDMKSESSFDDIVLEFDDLDVRRSLPSRGNSQIRKLTAENKKLRSAVMTLRAAVNEVKLLNTKLNYVSRLSSAFQMSKQQQIKMLESFDNASNSKEAKLVYETYSAMYNKAAKSEKYPAGLRQSASKKLTAIKESVAPRSYDPRKDRLQRLANIKPLHD